MKGTEKSCRGKHERKLAGKGLWESNSGRKRWRKRGKVRRKGSQNRDGIFKLLRSCGVLDS
jgi:hypothetical protein